ncbi:MAG: hypothetical protein IKM43_01800 [Clostridia bacterium]|nr:hypothetical protein [Clostridia bacterium]
MISLIIFLFAFVAIYVLNLVVFNNVLSVWTITWIYLVAVVGIIAINGVVAVLCAKFMPDKWFEGNKKFYNPSKKECRFYEKLGVKKWKDKTAELGALNSFRKNNIKSPNDPEYIKKFIVETNKGFLNHFVSLFVSIACIFIMPIKFWLPMALPIAVTSFVLNLIPVVILRYNMPRLQIMLKFAERKNLKNNDQ